MPGPHNRPPTAGASLCPHCGASLASDSRVCQTCGVDLVLVALLAERTYLERYAETPQAAVEPEAAVPRIGEYLVRQGLVNEAQLARALKRQAELASAGESRLLGQTLVDLQILDRETLDRAITRQILELHGALQQTNRTLELRVDERTTELRRALERLSELGQLKANLISNVSHELRTPMSQIVGYVDLLAQGSLGSLSPEQSDALQVVRRAVDRLERLVEDLVEFSSASRRGVTLDLTDVDLQPLAQEAIARLKDKAERARVRLRAEIPPGLPRVRADREKLGWVLHQLLDNGVKFTPPEGSVAIQASLQSAAVMICVRDTGIGIPRERIGELFEPFHQLDGSTTRRYGGTGLGLALVHLILGGHGASIRVESQEGAGTQFSFLLPASGPS